MPTASTSPLLPSPRGTDVAAGAGWGDARGCGHRGAPAEKRSPHGPPQPEPRVEGIREGKRSSTGLFSPCAFSAGHPRETTAPRSWDLSWPLGAAALDREHCHLSPSPARSTSQQPTGTAARGTSSWITAYTLSGPPSPAGREGNSKDPAASLPPRRRRRLSMLAVTHTPPSPPASFLGETLLGTPPTHGAQLPASAPRPRGVQHGGGYSPCTRLRLANSCEPGVLTA